jgi:hypothetical protein
MENQEQFDDRDTPGLSIEEIQWMAGRQFVGSLVVAVLIAAAALVTAMRPIHHDAADLSPHERASIRPPAFVAPPGQHLAAVRRGQAELP